MKSIFKALNDETRRLILEKFKDGDLTAGEIADHFNIGKPSISHHLDILRRSGLVSSLKKGQYVVYSLNTTVMDDLIKWIIKLKENNDKN